MQAASIEAIPPFFNRKAVSTSRIAILSRKIQQQKLLLKWKRNTPSTSDIQDLIYKIRSYSSLPSKECDEEGYVPTGIRAIDEILHDQVEVYLTYHQYNELCSKIPDSCQRLLSPEVFLMFAQDQCGRISGVCILQYVLQLHTMLHLTVLLIEHDHDAKGTFSEQELQEFIQDLIDCSAEDFEINDSFLPFYKLICSKILILPLGFQRLERGHLTIDRLAQCGLLQQFIQLMDPSLRELYESENNKFDPSHIRNIHKQYLQLDQDKNGLLNAKEMHLYGKKRAFNPKGSKPTHDLTSTFIQHVFEQTQTFPPGNEMDYKAYLEFTTYLTDKESIPSLRFFWRILDFGQNGYMDEFALDYFLKDVLSKTHRSSTNGSIQDSDNEMPSLETRLKTIKVEIFDMIKPKKAGIITWNDLKRSVYAHKVVRLLIDRLVYQAHEEAGSSG